MLSLIKYCEVLFVDSSKNSKNCPKTFCQDTSKRNNFVASKLMWAYCNPPQDELPITFLLIQFSILWYEKIKYALIEGLFIMIERISIPMTPNFTMK